MPAQPVERPRPAILRRRLVVRRAPVAVEAVLRARIADDQGRRLRFARERLAQDLDILDRDARVRVTEETEPGRRELRRVADERPETGAPGRHAGSDVETD